MQRFAEHIGFPDAFRVLLKLVQKEFDELLGLAFGSDDRVDLRLYIRLHHVDGGCARLQLHAVTARLLHDLRLFQREIVHRRHHDPVAVVHHIVYRGGDLVVFALCIRKLGYNAQQPELAFDLQTALFGKHGIEQRVRHIKRDIRLARAEVERAGMRGYISASEGGDAFAYFAHALYPGCTGAYIRKQLFL